MGDEFNWNRPRQRNHFAERIAFSRQLGMAVQHVHKETNMKRLCMAGGVALNCVANGRIIREGLFDDIWIQPAAGDAGGAVGIALAIWHRYLGNSRVSPEKAGTWRSARDQSNNGLPPYDDGMKGAFLG